MLAPRATHCSCGLFLLGTISRRACGYKQMKRLICTAALALVVSPAQAEMLLAEYGWDQPLPVTKPARYEFIVRESVTSSATVSLVADVAAFGTTAVNAATVAEFNDILAGVNGTQRLVYVSNAGQTPPRNNTAFDAIWNTISTRTFHRQAHIPRLGTGLFGYRITDMEHVITAQGQTVYFYGTVIPEPASCLLLLTGNVALIGTRFRR
jgi:hypothetical protein